LKVKVIDKGHTRVRVSKTKQSAEFIVTQADLDP